MAIERVRRLGRYAPLSATYYQDDALGEAGEAAELLFVRAMAYCAGRDEDGFMTRMQVIRFVSIGLSDVEDRITALVKCGAWLEEDGGYRVRSWLKWNKSADEIRGARRSDAARKAKPVDTDAVPSGIRAESERNPVGVRAESDPVPSGIQSESERIPPSSTEQCSTEHDTAEQQPHPVAVLPAPTVDAEIVDALTVVDDPNAGQILAQWIDYCAANGVQLPKRLIGQYAKGIKAALDETFTAALIKVALAGMLTDRVTDKPSVLTNRLVRAQTGPERRPPRMTPGETALARYVDQDPAVADVLATWYPEGSAA